MRTLSLDDILRRELELRRRSRVYLAGFTLAIALVLASLAAL